MFKKNKKPEKYNIKDLYIAISTKTGDVLLLEQSNTSPDQWFGNNTFYHSINKKEELLYIKNDVEAPANSSLIGLRPLTKYTGYTGIVEKKEALVIFNNIISQYFIDTEIIYELQSVKKIYDAWKDTDEVIIKRYSVSLENLDECLNGVFNEDKAMELLNRMLTDDKDFIKAEIRNILELLKERLKYRQLFSEKLIEERTAFLNKITSIISEYSNTTPEDKHCFTDMNDVLSNNNDKGNI